ncbi:MAG TPA: heparan-alpha-glucosaminide N-acetyltransferase domain-containing protein [Elusimicrobiota bacterium]|nr:heparan-alpha-glucosaminide N-acetyltransferase domain-containing protein [Elusimicrobiota bacterium]
MKAAGRILSLDLLRGVAVAAMIAVNCPGGPSVYPALRHSAWSGWTTADFIFPTFIFIMGASLAVALRRELDKSEPAAAILSRVLRRAVVIFLLGVLSVSFPFPGFAHMRVMGVLQRIAICYVAGALLFLGAGVRARAALAAAVLLAYWFAMTRIPVPGFGLPDLSPAGNLAAYVDARLLGAHRGAPYESEGLLSTLPAVVTALFGMFAGEALRRGTGRARLAAAFAAAGAAAIAAGLAWGRVFPVNKALWTSSYCVLTAGGALWALAACHAVGGLPGAERWTRPLGALGKNAIAAYFVAGTLYEVQKAAWVSAPGGGKEPLCYRATDVLFGGWLSPQAASLAYSLAYCVACLGIIRAASRAREWVFLRSRAPESGKSGGPQTKDRGESSPGARPRSRARTSSRPSGWRAASPDRTDRAKAGSGSPPRKRPGTGSPRPPRGT